MAPEQLYNVAVWDLVEGDLIESYEDVTFKEASDIERQYDDAPEANVVVTLSQ